MPATKDSNGTWISRFYYSDYKGDKKRVFKRGFITKKLALEYEREFLSKTKFDTEMSFKSLYDLYFEDMEHRLKKNTLMTKKNIIDIKILPFFKDIKVGDITPILIRKWQNNLLKESYSQTYIRTINNQLVAIFNYAIKYHNIKENPCHKAGTIGKKNADEMEIWSLEEFKTFIKSLEHKIISYTGFSLLFWTGIRIGELLALTLNDIDFENKKLTINKSFQRLEKQDVITSPKTPKSNRVIDLNDEVVCILKKYVDTLYQPSGTARLFNSTKFRFEYDIKNYSIKSGVKKIRIHDLRHSHASLLIQLGINPILISKRLGHEKVDTTLNTYSHLYPDANTELLNLLNKLKDSQ